MAGERSSAAGPPASRREVTHHDEWCLVAVQREGGAGDAEVCYGLPVCGRRHGDGGRDPGAVPSGPRAGQLDGHRRPGLDPGRVHRRPGLFRRRRLQPAGLADPQDRDHPGHRGGAHRVGPPGRGASAGRGGAGRRGDIGVGRADDLRLDRQAPAGLPAGRGRDPGDRGAGGDGRAGPGRAGRGDLRPVAARRPGQGPGRGVRGPVRRGGDHVRRRRGPVRGPDAGVRVDRDRGAGRAVGPGRRGG